MKLLKSLVLCLILGIGIVHAETFPSRPVKLVTNMSVGSGPDVVIRRYAQELENLWRVPVLVENRPGAGGAVALDYFHNSKDSHTVYIGDASSITTMPYLYNRQHLLTNLQPLFMMYSNDWVVVSSSKYSSSAQSIQSFKAKPMFGSWAVGSVGQICGHELANFLINDAGVHVAYKEVGTWFSDVINQDLPLSCTSFTSSMPHVASGRLKYVAVMADKRYSLAPDVPTVKEVFGENISIPSGWIGVFVKKNIDPKIFFQLESAFATTSTHPDIKKILAVSYISNNTAMKSKEFSSYIKQSTQEYKNAIKKFNIKVD